MVRFVIYSTKLKSGIWCPASRLALAFSRLAGAIPPNRSLCRGVMTVGCRLEEPADEPFVGTWVGEHVTAELCAWSWPEPMRNHLIGIQYTARRQQARSRYLTRSIA